MLDFISSLDEMNSMLSMCYILCMELDSRLTNDFHPMVLVFSPWFSNLGFGIRVLKVGKNLILYYKNSI